MIKSRTKIRSTLKKLIKDLTFLLMPQASLLLDLDSFCIFSYFPTDKKILIKELKIKNDTKIKYH